MNRDPFITKCIYHIYNRGANKKEIFNSNYDRYRFIRNLFEFNDKNPALHQIYKDQIYEVQPRIQLVEILSYCLMPNHFHLLLRQIKENGITTFMQKLGTGYTMYINKKYDRSGVLFQGRFKSVLINKESHLKYLPHYIHLNPLDLTMPSWRERKINKNKAISDIKNFQWSSIHDYLGQSKFPQILNTNFIQEIYDFKYKEELESYLNDFNILELDNIMLE